MPELPEVETVRLQLLRKIIGKKIKKAIVYKDSTVAKQKNFALQMQGKTFTHIDRIGKLLIFHFAQELDFFLLAHLKMTGQFFYSEAGSISGGGHSQTPSDYLNLPNKHTRLAFIFTDKSTLYFNDMRIFGYVKIATAAEVLKAKARFGTEPLDRAFDIKSFYAKLNTRRTSIKAALLDQKLIAGLGNIYVDETLFVSKINPSRITNKITQNEASLLIANSRKIMTKAIKAGGTTFQHFSNAEGNKGNFSNQLQVFGKQGQPCPCCQSLIIKIRCAGRGTHYCPSCQK